MTAFLGASRVKYAGRRVEWISSNCRHTATVIRKEGNWLRVALDLKGNLRGKTTELLIQPKQVRFMDDQVEGK